jgi:non-ribosomal peptide synthetase component F
LTTIPAQFEQTLSAVPDKAAVFSGDESLTFRQLHTEATAAAQALASLGVSPGDRVGICMQKTLDQVVAILGPLLANAIFVPIHSVLHADPHPSRAKSIRTARTWSRSPPAEKSMK